MARPVSVYRKKVMNRFGKTMGYNLSFNENIDENNLLAETSNLILNALTHLSVSEIAASDQKCIVYADEKVLRSGMLHLLDEEKYAVALSAGVGPSSENIEKVKKLYAAGYSLILDGFDTDHKTLEHARAFLKYSSGVRMDVVSIRRDEFEKVSLVLRSYGLNLYASNVNTKEQMHRCVELGFDYFEGEHIHSGEYISGEALKDVTGAVLMQIIELIKKDAETVEIEKYLKLKPQVVYNLIRYLNNNCVAQEELHSIRQVITLMGRKKLLRWLLVYLFSEISDSDINEMLLKIGLERGAVLMRRFPKDKERAFIVGLFSMLGKMFDTSNRNIFDRLKIDYGIRVAIVNHEGEMGKVLQEIENEERIRYSKILIENIDSVNTLDIALMLRESKVI